VQAQILELMIDLQKKINMSILMITHNLGSSPRWQRVIVMYCGKIVERRMSVPSSTTPFTPTPAAPAPSPTWTRTRLGSRRFPHGPQLYNLPRDAIFIPAVRRPWGSANFASGPPRNREGALGGLRTGGEGDMSNGSLLSVQGLKKHFLLNGPGSSAERAGLRGGRGEL